MSIAIRRQYRPRFLADALSVYAAVESRAIEVREATVVVAGFSYAAFVDAHFAGCAIEIAFAAAAIAAFFNAVVAGADFVPFAFAVTRAALAA